MSIVVFCGNSILLSSPMNWSKYSRYFRGQSVSGTTPGHPLLWSVLTPTQIQYQICDSHSIHPHSPSTQVQYDLPPSISVGFRPIPCTHHCPVAVFPARAHRRQILLVVPCTRQWPNEDLPPPYCGLMHHKTGSPPAITTCPCTLPCTQPFPMAVLGWLRQ